MQHSCLSGLVVLERNDRLATALCASLLAQLGATVVRYERAAARFDDLTPAAAQRALHSARAGKMVWATTPSEQHSWMRLVQRADVVLLTPSNAQDRQLIASQGSLRIVCSITDQGLAADQVALGELALQARSGIMAVTGARDGPAQSVAIPVVEIMTAINSATAILAALRVQTQSARAQLIDMAALDCGIALLPTFLPSVVAGQSSGYRLGAGHHLGGPWNAYPTVNGWIQLCSFNQSQWQRIAEVIGRADAIQNPAYQDAAGRVAHARELDAMVGAWTRQVTTEHAYKTFADAGVPAGQICTIPEVIANAALIRRAVVITDDDQSARVGTFFRFGRAQVVTATQAQAVPQNIDSLLEQLGPRDAQRAHMAHCGPPGLPLAGVRVLEIGPHTAGPLAGRYLCDLGAEVIKVEPPGGEASRHLQPQFGMWSGYFVNCNIGKKFISLNLHNDADRTIFIELAKQADVVLENLKPGALDRLGVGPRTALSDIPGLIVCSISGFGADGDQRPALDTVVQAEAGLMSLVGDGKLPHRIGVSLADQGAAHAAPLLILAALRFRSRTGLGQVIDLAMHDVMAWMTQLSWPDGAGALQSGPAMTALELDEVFAQDIVAQRHLVERIGPFGGGLPVLRAPYRLSLTPPAHGRICAVVDADRAEVLARLGTGRSGPRL